MPPCSTSLVAACSTIVGCMPRSCLFPTTPHSTLTNLILLHRSIRFLIPHSSDFQGNSNSCASQITSDASATLSSSCHLSDGPRLLRFIRVDRLCTNSADTNDWKIESEPWYLSLASFSVVSHSSLPPVPIPAALPSVRQIFVNCRFVAFQLRLPSC
jgi:hypothetical protein